MHQHTSRTFDSTTKRDESASAAAPQFVDSDVFDDAIALAAVYDAAGHLVELRFQRAPAVPRVLLKILAMCVPFHPLLGRLAVRWGPLAGDALYEIAKFLPLSHITEICLDDSPVPECNYYLLLEEPSNLRSLSLARCSLDDRALELLAARLHHPLPAARSLRTLTLAANRIADAGAAALADALRSNRTLQYLNLSGNRITDEGAGRLLGSLEEFSLTHDEIVATRRRRLEYLKLRDELAKKSYAELVAGERAQDEGGRQTARRRQTTAGRGRKASVDRERRGLSLVAGARTGPGHAGPLALRAQAIAEELAGAYSDPFAAEETVSRDGHVYSLGNATLCALNLAYNELSYASVLRLRAVLRAQAAQERGAGAGLMRVLLEGNALPGACRALGDVEKLLEHALAGRIARPQKEPPKHDRAVAKAKSRRY